MEFLFERKGRVRVSIENGEKYTERLEKLIETGLEAGAEDYEQLSQDDEPVIEMQVGTRRNPS